MKRSEIKKCPVCGEGLMNGGQIMFYRIKVESMVFDVGAIQRRQGLEMMLNPVLAGVMGPDEDLANGLASCSVMICGKCMMNPASTLGYLVELIELASDE